MNRMIVIVFVFIIVCVTCTGCGSSSLDELVPVRDLSYNRIEKNTALVVKGDITPVFDKPLELVGYEERKYREDSEEYEALEAVYKLKLASVNCQVGGQVRKGDVLVSFTSDELDKQIKEKEEEKRLAKLELQHVKELEEIDDEAVYSEQIRSIKQQIKICDLYIQDISSKYKEINIICEEDGVVRYINPSLLEGYVVPNSDLIIVSRDDGYYEAQADDTISFDVTKTYEAGSGVERYELKVMENDAGNTDDNDENDDTLSSMDTAINDEKKHTVYFKPINKDGRMLEKTILMETELNVLKNVCYVDKQAIIRKDDGDYVYVVDEQDHRRAVSVKTGDIVGEYCIILEGLSGGETVTLP
ncbi:MAG: hypothetical protein IJ661_10540 [Lachnospiraceae bacterium]|nr:hypothetical protein [Lachnospiraceae bacterium]